jgi:hypothetical protein
MEVLIYTGGKMRLNKNKLLIFGIIPIILGLVIFYNFITAIDILRPSGRTTYMIYYQLIGISTAMLVGFIVYWAIVVYYIYLIQENEVFIQDSFTELAGSGTAHLKNAKNIISKVLEDIKSTDLKQHQ